MSATFYFFSASLVRSFNKWHTALSEKKTHLRIAFLIIILYTSTASMYIYFREF